MKIRKSKIIVCPKTPRFQRHLHDAAMLQEELIAKFEVERRNFTSSMESDARQMEVIKIFERELGKNQIVSREDLTADMVADADLLILPGGDNHLFFGTHYTRDTPIMAVNTDDKTSAGGAIRFLPQDIEPMLQRLVAGEFEVEEWPTLSITVNGAIVGHATSEIFFGEKDRFLTSGNLITINGTRVGQSKGGGDLIATGVGASLGSWYDAECRYAFSEGNPFAPSLKKAAFISTAPNRGRLSNGNALSGELLPGQVMTVVSNNNTNGVIVYDPDNRPAIPFPRGTTALVQISARKLKVVKKPRGLHPRR